MEDLLIADLDLSPAVAAAPQAARSLTDAFNDDTTFRQGQEVYLALNPHVRVKRIRVGYGDDAKWVDEINATTKQRILQVPGDLRFFDVTSSELYNRNIVAQADGTLAVEVFFHGRMDAPLPLPELAFTITEVWDRDLGRNVKITNQGQAIGGSTWQIKAYVERRTATYRDSPEGAAQRAKREAVLLARHQEQVARYEQLKAELLLMKDEIVDMRASLALIVNPGPEAEERIAARTNLFHLLRDNLIDMKQALSQRQLQVA